MPWNTVMHRWKHGELHSGGPDGPVVHNQKQAEAILESEKRAAANGKTEYRPRGNRHRRLARMMRRKSK